MIKYFTDYLFLLDKSFKTSALVRRIMNFSFSITFNSSKFDWPLASQPKLPCLPLQYRVAIKTKK